MVPIPYLPIEADWEATVTEWLAALFRSPLTLASVISYRDGLGASLLEELEVQRGCTEGIWAMQATLAASASAEVLTRRLGADFVQLFEGAGGPRTVSPFESVHVSPGGRIFQAPAHAMDKMLASVGLQMVGNALEPADHLSIELALLAVVMRGDSQLEQQTTSLLESRLLGWVSGFAEAVEANDPTGFYAGAALLLTGFLAARRKNFKGANVARAALYQSSVAQRPGVIA